MRVVCGESAPGLSQPHGTVLHYLCAPYLLYHFIYLVKLVKRLASLFVCQCQLTRAFIASLSSPATDTAPAPIKAIYLTLPYDSAAFSRACHCENSQIGPSSPDNGSHHCRNAIATTSFWLAICRDGLSRPSHCRHSLYASTDGISKIFGSSRILRRQTYGLVLYERVSGFMDSLLFGRLVPGTKSTRAFPCFSTGLSCQRKAVSRTKSMSLFAVLWCLLAHNGTSRGQCNLMLSLAKRQTPCTHNTEKAAKMPSWQLICCCIIFIYILLLHLINT